MTLNTRQRKHLRGLTHALQPVVIVADKGLTENVMGEIESALNHHELVKIRLRADREQRGVWAREIEQRCGAERVHAIGQVVSYFRRNPEKPVVELPA
jgi:RNA-binding protein